MRRWSTFRALILARRVGRDTSSQRWEYVGDAGRGGEGSCRHVHRGALLSRGVSTNVMTDGDYRTSAITARVVDPAATATRARGVVTPGRIWRGVGRWASGQDRSTESGFRPSCQRVANGLPVQTRGDSSFAVSTGSTAGQAAAMRQPRAWIEWVVQLVFPHLDPGYPSGY